jgi:hypothetical protein
VVTVLYIFLRFSALQGVKMKRIAALFPAVCVVFVLSGCEALLTFNLFSSLDTPKTPSAEEFSAMADAELLSVITDLSESDTFFEDIAKDKDTRAAVVGSLIEIYSDGSEAETADKQQASLLVAEVELSTTQAGNVVNDFVNVLTEYVEEPPESGDAEAIAETVVTKAFSKVTEENFDETLDALLAAGEAYTFYGESLDDSGEIAVPQDTNAGAVAQDAIVAILVSEIVDTDGDQPELLSPEEFKAVVVDDEPFPEDFALENSPLEENQALVNILEASGLEDLFSA